LEDAIGSFLTQQMLSLKLEKKHNLE